MKPFEEWVMESPVEEGRTWHDWEAEGHGSIRCGSFFVECSRCGRDFAVSDFVEPEDFDPGATETYYCGASERCCP